MAYNLTPDENIAWMDWSGANPRQNLDATLRDLSDEDLQKHWYENVYLKEKNQAAKEAAEPDQQAKLQSMGAEALQSKLISPFQNVYSSL